MVIADTQNSLAAEHDFNNTSGVSGHLTSEVYYLPYDAAGIIIPLFSQFLSLR